MRPRRGWVAPRSGGYTPAATTSDPAVWAAALDEYDAEQRRRRANAEVRAAFLRIEIAGCGLPFSDVSAGA